MNVLWMALLSVCRGSWGDTAGRVSPDCASAAAVLSIDWLTATVVMMNSPVALTKL